ncbi:hypothetical protein RND81_07G125600 [Saponaria officinalis]|uniref:Late embryogenesis abundant protein LEA-2 subgroup domain-containing protein n=1 Tax=Saponaria officinalis TaxID=3572 RepID=A0AAW1JPS8_SAPOF
MHNINSINNNNNNYSNMFASKENTKPSLIPLVIWFIEVIIVLVFFCVVITMSFVPWPSTYTLTNPTRFDNQSNRDLATEVNTITIQNGTMIFSLVIANPNEGKDIIHGNITVTLYRDGSVVSVSVIQGFYQSQHSNRSSRVLVNVDQQRLLRRGDSESSGMLEVRLETWVRYRILRWTTERHVLKLEAFVPLNVNGTVLLDEEGVRFQPVKRKL